jgi:hypothetical protein
MAMESMRNNDTRTKKKMSMRLSRNITWNIRRRMSALTERGSESWRGKLINCDQ